MDFKKIGVILLLIFLIGPIKTSAQIASGGFVRGSIWYSVDPFSEGDKIKIYTVIFNPDERELSGTVIFFDNSVFLGKKDFTAPAKGVKDIFVEWTVTAGEHKIFGKIESAKFLLANGKYEEIYLAENKTEENTRTVNKKVTLKTADLSKSLDTLINSASAAGSQSIKNIIDFIALKTPEFITKPITFTTKAMEKVRTAVGNAMRNKKAAVQAQIKTLDVNEKNNTKIPAEAKTEKINTNKFLKPFKYIELFLIAFFSFILNNKFIFYGTLIIILILIARYIWNLIF